MHAVNGAMQPSASTTAAFGNLQNFQNLMVRADRFVDSMHF
jgi:hypothetical protein